MKIKKAISLGISLILILAVFAGCTNQTASEEQSSDTSTSTESTAAPSEETTSSEGTKRIFFTNAYYTAPYCAPLNAAAKAAAESAGYEITIVDGQGNAQVQLDQINTAIAEKYDGIIYFPADMASTPNVVRKLVDSGIPFVNDNSKVDPSVQDQVHFVGFETYDEGYDVGELVKEMLPDGGNVVIIEGVAGTDPQVNRTQGFKDAIADTPSIKILDAQAIQGYDPALGLAIAEDYFSKYGDQIDVLFAHGEDGIDAIAMAGKDAGLDKIRYVSIGGNSIGIAAIKDGILYGTISQSPLEEGKIAVETLIKLINGEDVPLETIIDTPPITIENVDEPQFANPGW